ncbi:hypothetical protein DICPUDRAFT_34798, partial [Dictyostelium purpureum]
EAPKPSISKLASMFNKPAAETVPQKATPNFKIPAKKPLAQTTAPTNAAGSTTTESANNRIEQIKSTSTNIAGAGSSSPSSPSPSTSSPIINSTQQPIKSNISPISSLKTSPILKSAANSSEPSTPSFKAGNRAFPLKPAASSAPNTPAFKGAAGLKKSPSNSESISLSSPTTTPTTQSPNTQSPTLAPTKENNTTNETTPISSSNTTPTISPISVRPQTLVYVLPPLDSKEEPKEPIKTPQPAQPIKKLQPQIKKEETSKPINNELLNNNVSKLSSETIQKEKRGEFVRVLSNIKGDFSSLTVQRGDILEIKEKGEKDTYFGSNGFKSGSFSISNTKLLYPKSHDPPADSQKVVAIKDIRTSNNYTVIRGDVLSILEKKSDKVYSGRVKVGLDGWGEMVDFPADSVRNINDKEYQLFSDLLDVVIEVSEQLMDPESFSTSSPRSNSTTSKISEKQIEKNQLVLRDRVKSVQTVREKILNSENSDPALHATLRKEIEITRAFLSNEFYIVDDNGEILTHDNESPMKLLKYHYQMYEKKKDTSSGSSSSVSTGSAASSSSKSSLTLASQTGNQSSSGNLHSSSVLSQSINSSSSASNSTSTSNSQDGIHKKQWDYGQILCDIKLNKCTLPAKKNYEFYFSLYNFSQSRYITEQVKAEWDTVANQNASFRFLLKNIEPSDITEDICFLCKVVRKGPFKDVDENKDLKKGTNTDFRRPFAFACISAPNLLVENQIGLERTSNLQFYSTNSTDISISQIPDFIMKNSDDEIKKHLDLVPKATSGLPQSILPISLSFYDQTFDSFSSKFPQYNQLTKVEKLEHKIVFSEKIHKFYMTLDSGKFAQGKKMEVIIKVRLEDGEYLENCISLGSGSNYVSEIHTTTVLLNNGTSIWNESIHFNIPEKHFPKAHILFFVKNRSNTSSKEKNSLVGFSCIKLGNEDSTVISNGDHVLQMFKLTSIDQIPPISSYIDFNSNNSSSNNSANSSNSSPQTGDKKEKDKHSIIKKNETLKIKSLLHSSDFIQHQSVIQLLNWRNNKNIISIFDRFKFVDPIQIMRNLNKILDSLLSIFDLFSNTSSDNPKAPNENTLMVYNTLVFVMGLLTDERTNRFKHFKSEMDHYIVEQFSIANTHKHLLRCISNSIKDISSKETAKMSNTLKTLEFMFRIITKSRLVYTREKGSSPEEESQWKDDLREFLGLLNKLMSNSNQTLLIVPQTFAIKNFAVIMKGLGNFFTHTELCIILSDFMETVYYSDKNFYQLKLTVYHKILSTQLPIGPDTYQHLLPALVSTIDQHLNKGEELRLANQLLALLLESIQSLEDVQDRNKALNIVAIIFSKMFSLVDTCLSNLVNEILFGGGSSININTENTFLVSNFYTTIHYFLKHDGGYKYSNLLEKYMEETLKEEKNIKVFIKKLLKILEGFLSKLVYSLKWPTLNLFQYQVTISTLETIEPYCIKYFSDSNDWALLFNVKFAFLNTPTLKLSENRINRLNYIKTELDSIRINILNSISSTWDYVNKMQIQNQLYQNIVVHLLYSLLNGNNQVNEFAQNFFYLIMKNEFNENKSLKKVESKTIEVLDKITIRERICDEEIFKNFLMKRLTNSIDSDHCSFNKEAKSFISNIIQLLSLLFEFRTLPTDRAFEEERTIATLKMMEYFKDRKDTYIKYLYELLNQHLTNGYFTEAGFTLLLHSDLYEWNSEQIIPIYNLNLAGNNQPIMMPQETATERKVRLMKLAIQYLDKGQVWERCITLLQDLKQHYEETFNYKGLSEACLQEAEFYEKILNTERFFSEYFRVGYYGKKFPVSIQGKEFLYKGFELERLPDFTQRILSKFPDAELLKTTSEPTVEIQNSDGQYLLITIVNPSNQEEVEKRQKQIILGTPNNSKNYIKRNDVNVFVYSKPFEKASGAVLTSNNKFGDLWIKNHFLFTHSSFPTIHRRAEVIKKQVVDLSPIENAINSVFTKNEELDEMVKKYEKNPQLNLNPLAMALNGMIDAAVNGGISLYKEAFYQVAEAYRPQKQFLSKLSSELTRQSNILECGLQIHSKRCPDELRGLHEKLESFFPKLQSEIESIQKLI